MRGFHVSLLGLTLGPLDTILDVAALLVIAGGLYAQANIGPSRPGRVTRAMSGKHLMRIKRRDHSPTLECT
jgi:hypothetical protein